MLCAASTSERNQEHLEQPKGEPLLQSAPIAEVPQPRNPFYQEDQAQFLLCLITEFQYLPAHRIIQTSQSHPTVVTRGYPNHVMLQSLPPFTLPCLLSSRAQALCGPARCVVSYFPGLWVYVTNKSLLISCVQCQVLCVQPSPRPQGGNFPSPMG